MRIRRKSVPTRAGDPGRPSLTRPGAPIGDETEQARDQGADRRRRRALRRAKQKAVRTERNRRLRARNGLPEPEHADEKALAGPPEDKMLRPGDVGAEVKGDPLGGVPFGSSAAERLARRHELTAEHFAGRDPSGTSGFTKPDVRALLDEVAQTEDEAPEQDEEAEPEVEPEP